MKFYATALAFIVILTSCTNHKQIDIKNKKDSPKNLNETFTYLTEHTSAFELIKFKNKTESEATNDWFETKGLWIRNNWIRGSRDTALVEYFHRLNLYNPEDISAVIIRSFHRRLNDKDIDLKNQISICNIYWQNISDCENKAKLIAVNQYKKHALNSAISIQMAVETSGSSGNLRNAVIYECGSSKWIFNPKIDLQLTGTIVEKHFFNDSSNVFFKVRIESMSRANTAIFSDIVKIGTVVNFPLKNLTILN